MKRLIYLFLTLTFFQFNTSIIIAQDDIDTTFPTIKNDPNINLEALEHAEPEPDNMKPEKKDKTVATWGKRQSFFTNIIQGLLVMIIGMVAWWLYQKWKTNSATYEEE